MSGSATGNELRRQLARLQAENQRAEGALRAERDKLLNVLESMGDGVYIANAQHVIEYANQTLVRGFGPFRGRTCYEYLGREEGSCPCCREGAITGEGNWRWEWEHPGSGRIFDVANSLLRNPDGSVSYLAILRDITDIRRAAIALAEEAQRKDDLVALLAHELRNPLTPLLHAAQITRMTADPDAVGEAAAVIERQVRHMSRLIDDLLDAARVSRGKIKLYRAPVDLALVVQSVVQNSAESIEESGVRLELDLPPGEVVVDGDPVRLSQIVTNLLSNALKFTDAGDSVRLAVYCDSGQGGVRVSDTGIGIAAVDLERIFTMFERAAPGRGGGLGLGLALARDLARLHQGALEASSPGPGGGSAFELGLPLCLEGRDAAPLPQAPPVVAPSRRLRVMVVDDNPDVATAVGVPLELVGHEVRVLFDGASALEEARSFRPEAVILDLGLEGMDGCEVARRLRREIGAGALLLVALTGWGDEADFRRTRDAGFDHHLVKPADPEALIELLARHAGQSAGEQPTAPHPGG